jgi:phage gpG-like protein
MEFTFEAYGEKLIARRIERLAGRAVAARPAFQAIGSTLRGYETRLFDSQGTSGGATWEPLKESTIRQKARSGLDPRVLHATTRLRRSLTEEHHPDHVERATDDSLSFGSRVPYAGRHQRGRGVPRRRPLQYTEAQKRYLLKKLQRYVLTGEV